MQPTAASAIMSRRKEFLDTVAEFCSFAKKLDPAQSAEMGVVSTVKWAVGPDFDPRVEMSKEQLRRLAVQ